MEPPTAPQAARGRVPEGQPLPVHFRAHPTLQLALFPLHCSEAVVPPLHAAELLELGKHAHKAEFWQLQVTVFWQTQRVAFPQLQVLLFWQST